MKILFLKNSQLDKSKWDHCVENADNPLVYARSFYLDIVSPGWNALVLGDYKMVMPLTAKRKFGISYLAQPNFAQQLGVFGRGITVKILKDFISAMSAKYCFAEIHLNYLNPLVDCRKRTNYVLNLDRPYDELEKGYTEENRKNLNKAQKRGAQLAENLTVEDVIRLYRETYGAQNPQLKHEDYGRFKLLAAELKKREMLELLGVRSNEGKLCAASCFINDGKRAVYVMGAADPEGRRLQATHFLLDGFIRKNAGREMILDFEGSEIPGVKHFYEKFGPENQPFYQLKINNLPFPLRLLKR